MNIKLIVIIGIIIKLVIVVVLYFYAKKKLEKFEELSDEQKEELAEEEQAFELINNRPDVKSMNTSITGMCIGLCRLKKFRNNFFGDSNNKTAAEEPSKDMEIPAACTAKYRKENKITDYIGDNGSMIADCAEFDTTK